ncbi:unnamed protein product [Cuscuta campestris]|uniref:Uncharacterized protein n=1 Tax=Cuscuta campestris TaxID=132261 RepID=A0A484MZB5_9ASTE|nr:unnamed protein product [Cuscuta campestris]
MRIQGGDLNRVILFLICICHHLRFSGFICCIGWWSPVWRDTQGNQRSSCLFLLSQTLRFGKLRRLCVQGNNWVVLKSCFHRLLGLFSRPQCAQSHVTLIYQDIFQVQYSSSLV